MAQANIYRATGRRKTSKARVYLKQGRLDKVQAWVAERGLSVGDEASYLREFELLTLTRVLITSPGVNELLTRLLRAAETQNRLGSVLQILLTQALAYRAQGDMTAAFAALERDDRQTAQSQPIWGTPKDVPVPRNVSRMP